MYAYSDTLQGVLTTVKWNCNGCRNIYISVRSVVKVKMGLKMVVKCVHVLSTEEQKQRSF